jgi:hypothetical protein
MTTTDDGLHDPAEQPTEPLDETPEERKARLGTDEESEQEQEARQQERAEKRKAAKKEAAE